MSHFACCTSCMMALWIAMYVCVTRVFTVCVVCMYVCILCNGMNTCRFITHTQMSHYSLVGVSRSLSRNAFCMLCHKCVNVALFVRVFSVCMLPYVCILTSVVPCCMLPFCIPILPKHIWILHKCVYLYFGTCHSVARVFSVCVCVLTSTSDLPRVFTVYVCVYTLQWYEYLSIYHSHTDVALCMLYVCMYTL